MEKSNQKTFEWVAVQVERRRGRDSVDLLAGVFYFEYVSPGVSLAADGLAGAVLYIGLGLWQRRFCTISAGRWRR